jgi:hypothetical protein
MDSVILTEQHDLDYASTMEALRLGHRGRHDAYFDKRLGVYFLDEVSRQKAVNLLSLSCPLPLCKTMFLDRKEFVVHAKKSHQLLIWYGTMVYAFEPASSHLCELVTSATNIKSTF